MVEPVTTTTAILAIIGRSAATAKDIYDVLLDLKNAPHTIKRVQEEADAIGGSLTAIKSALEYNPTALETADLLDRFYITIDACRTVVSRVDAYLATLTAGAQWRQRIKTLWNENELNTLLDELRGKQASLSLLIQILNMHITNHLAHQFASIVVQTPLPALPLSTERKFETASPIESTDGVFGGNCVRDATMRDSVITEFEFDSELLLAWAYQNSKALKTAPETPAWEQTRYSDSPKEDSDCPLMALLEAEDVLKLMNYLKSISKYNIDHEDASDRLKDYQSAMLDAYEGLRMEAKMQTAVSYRSELAQNKFEKARIDIQPTMVSEDKAETLILQVQEAPSNTKNQTRPMRIGQDSPPIARYQTKPRLDMPPTPNYKRKPIRVDTRDRVPAVKPEFASQSAKSVSFRHPPITSPANHFRSLGKGQLLSSAVERAAKQLIREQEQEWKFNITRRSEPQIRPPKHMRPREAKSLRDCETRLYELSLD